MNTDVDRMPEVSVIIPTYNRAPLLPFAVRSVLTQTYPHCHVVLVDDGSTDDTAAVVAAEFGQEPRVRYFRQENGGAASARNRALREAKGDYIALLDSDDTWYPHKLAAQTACLRALEKDNVGMLWADMDIANEEGKLEAKNANRTYFSNYQRFKLEETGLASDRLQRFGAVPGVEPATRVWWGDVFALMSQGNLTLPGSVLMTRHRAEQTGFFDESMRSGEDSDYFLRASALGACAFLDLTVWLYRRGAADQLTAGRFETIILKNALRSFEGVMVEHGWRLGPGVARRRRAALHAMIGTSCARQHDNKGARAHLVQALLRKPAKPRLWAMLGAACLPVRVTDYLRELKARA
jgi:GT2 family glycosyltransferase